MTDDSAPGATLPPLERILWIDAYAENHWCWEAPEIDPQRCVSIGYLVAEDDDYLLLAGTLGLGDRQSNARFAIPKGCVLARDRLDARLFEATGLDAPLASAGA